MLYKETLLKETQEAKYALESFVYSTRTHLYEAFNLQLTTEQEKEAISQALGVFENWLYNEGRDVSKQIYLDKLKEL